VCMGVCVRFVIGFVCVIVDVCVCRLCVFVWCVCVVCVCLFELACAGVFVPGVCIWFVRDCVFVVCFCGVFGVCVYGCLFLV